MYKYINDELLSLNREYIGERTKTLPDGSIVRQPIYQKIDYGYLYLMHVATADVIKSNYQIANFKSFDEDFKRIYVSSLYKFSDKITKQNLFFGLLSVLFVVFYNFSGNSLIAHLVNFVYYFPILFLSDLFRLKTIRTYWGDRFFNNYFKALEEDPDIIFTNTTEYNYDSYTYAYRYSTTVFLMFYIICFALYISKDDLFNIILLFFLPLFYCFFEWIASYLIQSYSGKSDILVKQDDGTDRIIRNNNKMFFSSKTFGHLNYRAWNFLWTCFILSAFNSIYVAFYIFSIILPLFLIVNLILFKVEKKPYCDTFLFSDNKSKQGECSDLGVAVNSWQNHRPPIMFWW